MANQIVVPGEMLSQKPLRMRGAYIENGKTYADVIGAWDEPREKFIPLESIYLPEVGDAVLGVVEEERIIGYSVELGSPYKGLLFSRGLRTRFAPRDIVYSEIMEVSEVKDVILSRPRRLIGGKMIYVSPAKISRIIGKRSSMVEMISQMTRCEIFVGRNGAIWLRGEKVQKAIDAIMKIEKEAHTSGLTDRIQRFLSSN